MADKTNTQGCIRSDVEQTLRESNDRLELAQHIANLGSWEFNTKKDEALWSKQLYDMFELNPASSTKYRRILKANSSGRP